MQATVFIATTLDGFIARNDGSLDWLDKANQVVTQGEDCGYHAFFKSIDALVMGRNSFEKVLSFGSWPYADKKVVVLSSQKIHIPEDLAATVSVSSHTPTELVHELTAQGIKHIYVDGGVTIQGFLREGLIDELIITTIPVLIGEGKPLFGSLPADISLRAVASKCYDFGFVQTHYVITKNHHPQ